VRFEVVHINVVFLNRIYMFQSVSLLVVSGSIVDCALAYQPGDNGFRFLLQWGIVWGA
jgi:hypothetical protein